MPGMTRIRTWSHHGRLSLDAFGKTGALRLDSSDLGLPAQGKSKHEIDDSAMLNAEPICCYRWMFKATRIVMPLSKLEEEGGYAHEVRTSDQVESPNSEIPH